MDENGLEKANILAKEINAMGGISTKFYGAPHSIGIKITHMADKHGNGVGSFEITEATPQAKEVIRAFYRDIKKSILFDLETKKIQFGKI